MSLKDAANCVDQYFGKWCTTLGFEEYCHGMMGEIAEMEGVAVGTDFRPESFLDSVHANRYLQIVAEIRTSIDLAQGDGNYDCRLSEIDSSDDLAAMLRAATEGEEDEGDGMGMFANSMDGAGSEMMSKGERRLDELYILIRPLFDAVNTSQSGYIETNELRSFWLKTGTSEEFVDYEVSEYMAKWDADGDGRLSFEEYYNMMRVPREYEGTPEDLETYFNTLDSREFAGQLFGLKALAYIASTTGPVAVSGSERVAELTRLVRSLFDELDTNKDGLVHKDDLKKFYGKMGIQRDVVDEEVETFLAGLGKPAVSVTFDGYYELLMTNVILADAAVPCSGGVLACQEAMLENMSADVYLKSVMTVKAFESLAASPAAPRL